MTSGGAAAAHVPVRDAATVVLLRDGADELDVWLLVRVREMVFAGGMAVFPGGRVDESDAALPLDAAAVALTAERFGCDDAQARALLGAAVRETFEETGVLLGEPAEALADARADVEAGRVRFNDLVARHGVRLDAAALRPWARWVTPVGEPRRYDTRFFVGSLPAAATPQDVTTESSAAGWFAVRDAVAQAEAGQLRMLPPTLITLAELAHHQTVADVLAAADERRIDAVRPELQTAPDGRLHAVLPGGATVSLPPVRGR